MELFMPQYYSQFRCIAAACEDSCCQQWEVDVDPDSAAFYRGLPGELGDRLRRVLRDTDSSTVMTIENDRCPMWREDGLCRIQAQYGHDALCRVCREFPRLRHDYGDFAELGLELSCPEAARLILTSPAQDILTHTQPGGDTPDYDPQLMATLRRSRKDALAFLDSSAYTVSQTLAILLLFAHEVQGEIDGGEAVSLAPEVCLQAARRYRQTPDLSRILDFFKSLEILTTQWKARLDAPAPATWSPRLLALARYFIRRYWLQAVADYDLVCRVKFAITACILVNALGGDPVQTAQLFSKEIENDPDNVEAILDGAYTSPALTDSNLLGLLLC